MNARRCLKIADRIDAVLQLEIGIGVDLQRMLAEPLYARDVLLVCDAHPGHELADLARDFRTAADEEAPAEPSARASGYGESAPGGFVSSLFGAFRASVGDETIERASHAAREVGAASEARAEPRAWYSPARWRGR